jgi:hypothetical protein
MSLFIAICHKTKVPQEKLQENIFADKQQCNTPQQPVDPAFDTAVEQRPGDDAGHALLFAHGGHIGDCDCHCQQTVFARYFKTSLDRSS